MDTPVVSATTDSELQKTISVITQEIVSALDGRIYGIWLYGSVTMDDFRPGWSDIDFVALTESEITEVQAERLLMLRQVLTEREDGTPYFRSFEGIIANVAEYRSGAFRRLVYWGTSGQRITDTFSHDAFSRYALAVCGQSVYGEKTWPFPKPEKKELVQAVRNHYETIRRFAVQTGANLYACGWLLDIARCIYTLRTGDVISKTAAGIWAVKEHIFHDDEALRRAIEIRENPLLYKEEPETKEWLAGLGSTVQDYADVLEGELLRAGN